MPHIIVEYTPSLETKIPALLEQLHESLTSQGIDKKRIKTRGISINHCVVGSNGANADMLHTTLLLLEGRTDDTKQTYGTALHNILKTTASQDVAVTLEIRDMKPSAYFM